MKIIITKTFEKDFYNIFNSYKILDFFVKKIKTTNLISLNNEYKKIKFDLFNQSIRWIVYIENDNLIYVPIFIVKKFDKKYWMNLILTKDLLSILNLKFEKSIIDINSNNYKVY